MKTLIVVLLAVLSTEVFAQPAFDLLGNPFQVIYAHNVRDHNGKKIDSLEYIHINHTLKVEAGGFLSLMHYSGIPIEFDRDTVINIRSLHQKVAPSAITKWEIKKRYVRRPSIENLYVTNRATAQKNILNSMIDCYDCNLDLSIFYPPKTDRDLFLYDDDLCLVWEASASSQYDIEIRNMLDELVKKYTSETNTITIPRSELTSSMLKNENALKVRIVDHVGKTFSEYVNIKKFMKAEVSFPYSCSLHKPTYALAAAVYLEYMQANTKNGFRDEAEKFYKLAAQMSDREFFKTMLENFYLRHPQKR